MTLLEFRVLGRLSTSVLGALDSVVGIAELESLKKTKLLGVMHFAYSKGYAFYIFPSSMS